MRRLVEVGALSSASSVAAVYPRRFRAWTPRPRTDCAWRAPVGEGRGSPLPGGPRANLPSPVSLMNEPRRWGLGCAARAVTPGAASLPGPDIFILQQWTFSGGCLRGWILQRQNVWNQKGNGSVLCAGARCNRPTPAAGSFNLCGDGGDKFKRKIIPFLCNSAFSEQISPLPFQPHCCYFLWSVSDAEFPLSLNLWHLIWKVSSWLRESALARRVFMWEKTSLCLFLRLAFLICK